MNGPGIKICGLSRIEDIQAVNEYLPDYIGFVFAPSKRQISGQAAATLKKELSPAIKAVGVFVNSPIDKITALVQQGIIDAVQLHGDMETFETPQYARDLREALKALRKEPPKELPKDPPDFVPVIRAVRVRDEKDILCAAAYPSDYLLLDTYVKGQYGGCGICFDWTLIPHIEKPWFLAGGLDVSNIKDALDTEAFCLDVSSAVETNGKKDPEKIKEIIQTVRSTQSCQKENLDSTADNLSPKR